MENKVQNVLLTIIILLLLIGVTAMSFIVLETKPVLEKEEVKYDNRDYVFTYFDKGIYIMDNFNPIRRASYYKCEMGKTYPYSLS